MKYVANPVEVDAFASTKLVNPSDKAVYLILDNGDQVLATIEMCARYFPKIGDYWVIQSDGYVYLNPKDVFERKYRLA